jgi:hypothetical protein
MNPERIPVIDPSWTKNLTVNGVALPRITRVEPGTVRGGADVLISAQDLPPEEDLVRMCNNGFLRVYLKKHGVTTPLPLITEWAVRCYPYIESNRRRVGFQVPAIIAPPRGQQWDLDLKLQLGSGTNMHRTTPVNFTVTGAPAPKASITFTALRTPCEDDEGYSSDCNGLEPFLVWVVLWPDGARAGVRDVPNRPGGSEILFTIAAMPLTEVKGTVVLMYQIIENDDGGPSLAQIRQAAGEAAAGYEEYSKGNLVESTESSVEFIYHAVSILSDVMGGGDDIGPIVIALFTPDSITDPEGPRARKRDRLWFEDDTLPVRFFPDENDIAGRIVHYPGTGRPGNYGPPWDVIYLVRREVPQ